MDEESRTAGTAAGGRQLILRGTYAVVRSQGFHRATVSDICREAGIARATFYVYFGSKLDAFVATMEDVVERLYEEAGQRYPDEDEYGRIVRGNVTYLQAWARDREVLAEWFALALIDDRVGETYRKRRDQFEERLEGRISRLIAAGRIPATDARMLAVTLSGMVESFVRRFLAPGDHDLEEPAGFQAAVRVVSEAWYRMVYGEQPPAYDYSRFCLQSS